LEEVVEVARKSLKRIGVIESLKELLSERFEELLNESFKTLSIMTTSISKQCHDNLFLSFTG
jgi:hypothetical protein